MSSGILHLRRNTGVTCETKLGATQVKQNQAAAVVVHADSLETPCFANKNITAINFIN